jgi:hypothetical protein
LNVSTGDMGAFERMMNEEEEEAAPRPHRS